MRNLDKQLYTRLSFANKGHQTYITVGNMRNLDEPKYTLVPPQIKGITLT